MVVSVVVVLVLSVDVFGGLLVSEGDEGLVEVEGLVESVVAFLW
jgi:hypothetical protein